MDLTAVAAMIFVVTLVGMVGGFFLLLPVSRRLGQLLEQRLKTGSLGAPSVDLQRLEGEIQSLRKELDLVAERQAFTESLVSQRPPALIAEAGGVSRGPVA